METKSITFKRDRTQIECECGQFRIDILRDAHHLEAEVRDHARSHGVTTIHIIDAIH